VTLDAARPQRKSLDRDRPRVPKLARDDDATAGTRANLANVLRSWRVNVPPDQADAGQSSKTIAARNTARRNVTRKEASLGRLSSRTRQRAGPTASRVYVRPHTGTLPGACAEREVSPCVHRAYQRRLFKQTQDEPSGTHHAPLRRAPANVSRALRMDAVPPTRASLPSGQPFGRVLAREFPLPPPASRAMTALAV